MKRIRVYEFGGPEVLKLEEAPALEPTADQVLVRVKAAGVNPYDTYMRAGAYGGRTPSLPYTPGSDAAGVVEAIGKNVHGVALGERVYTSGTVSGAYAELALCTSSDVHSLPERVSFAQGAGIYVPYGTAYRSLFQLARARAGETLLVHGASGSVGLAAIQLARAHGMTVIGTAGTAKGLAAVTAEGAQVAVDHHAPGYEEKIREATGGQGADVILEMLANVNLSRDLKLMAPRGRVVVVGSRGTIEVTPRDLMASEGTVMGVMLWKTPPSDLCEIHAGLAAGLDNGTLVPRVREELPLASAPEAHRRVLEPGALGKIVLVP